MEPECVEHVESLSGSWAKLQEFLLRNKRTDLQFLQFSQIKALTAETHIHVRACIFVESRALSQTTRVQNLFLIRTAVYVLYCFNVL